MTTRRAIVTSLAGLLLASDGRAQSAPWASLRAPDHFALIRHALAPGTFDPPGFRVDDCATQRNLSAEGRAQAIRIGELFRANGIAAARLYSSQWCRCLETATLMKLGDVSLQPLLNSFAQNRDRAVQQTAALRPWIAQLELAGPTVMVTHQVVITALSEVFPGSGEIVVMRREPDGRLAVAGRLPTA
ncbi:histidine phosphatase family protein [Reyranella sp.]|uniref:histidine phosphatase family protein n=1 Tax=Reyranella sp. TaxID=1929291 RepID=UPI002731D0A2|nr:histidine phosphatase family protein [Reyranella sp.]MDP2376013.1 histidine phosphatase family protein [Reyranella sp.]